MAHQRRKLEEDLAWFDRHLFGTHEAPNPALKKGSPLDRHLARAQASRVGGAYGVHHGEELIPETVASDILEGVEVGRFEVTAAQLAASNREATAPATPNHPATGVLFVRAEAYVARLAKITDRPFRLPTVQEAQKLAKSAGTGGNTLNHWAGYPPNPEDAERLRQATSALTGAAPLLRPVGSFGGLGTDPVYDLDGNVAEWAVDEKRYRYLPSVQAPTVPPTPAATADPTRPTSAFGCSWTATRTATEGSRGSERSILGTVVTLERPGSSNRYADRTPMRRLNSNRIQLILSILVLTADQPARCGRHVTHGCVPL